MLVIFVTVVHVFCCNFWLQLGLVHHAVPAKRFVGKIAFCTSQVISWKDCLLNDLQCVDWDVELYYHYYDCRWTS